MPRSKELTEDTRKKIIEAHQSGKGYKLIASTLGLQKSTIRSIVQKWKVFGTVITRPRSGRPPKISSIEREKIIQEVMKNPFITPKHLRATLALEKIQVHDSTIRKILGVHRRPSLSSYNGDQETHRDGIPDHRSSIKTSNRGRRENIKEDEQVKKDINTEPNHSNYSKDAKSPNAGEDADIDDDGGGDREVNIDNDGCADEDNIDDGCADEDNIDDNGCADEDNIKDDGCADEDNIDAGCPDKNIDDGCGDEDNIDDGCADEGNIKDDGRADEGNIEYDGCGDKDNINDCPNEDNIDDDYCGDEDNIDDGCANEQNVDIDDHIGRSDKYENESCNTEEKNIDNTSDVAESFNDKNNISNNSGGDDECIISPKSNGDGHEINSNGGGNDIYKHNQWGGCDIDYPSGFGCDWSDISDFSGDLYNYNTENWNNETADKTLNFS